MNHQYLPSDLDVERIVACLGLISDTHMPDRWPGLQPSIFETLAGVDLILHAGDVGELWVLDQLSTIAPIVAVHGNDETAEAQAALPFQQLLAISGYRILLSHGHLPDRTAELTSRVGDAWGPKLAAKAARAQSLGATIYISGHWHIPYVIQSDGVWLINPGAIASGSPTTRQHIQTVALLYLRDDGQPFVVHVDVTGTPTVHTPLVDWESGFMTTHSRYLGSILTPELEPFVATLRSGRYFDDPRARELFTALGREVWAGRQEAITVSDVRHSITENTTLSAAERVELLATLNDTAVR